MKKIFYKISSLSVLLFFISFLSFTPAFAAIDNTNDNLKAQDIYFNSDGERIIHFLSIKPGESKKVNAEVIPQSEDPTILWSISKNDDNLKMTVEGSTITLSAKENITSDQNYLISAICDGIQSDFKVIIVSPSHVHLYYMIYTSPLTCIDPGQKEYYCACGYIKKESIPPLGHDFEDGICVRCGEPDSSGIAPEEEINDWDYSIDENNRIITLKQYINNKNTDVTVYRYYKLDGKIYKTAIASNEGQNISKYMFFNKNNIKSITFQEVDTSKTTSMDSMFYSCASLVNLDLHKLDTSNVTNMSYMFKLCMSLTTLDVSKFDTNKVTKMDEMFGECVSLKTLDLSSFDTSSVETMNWMFHSCQSLENLNLKNFDTKNVKDFGFMFQYCASLQTLDLSDFEIGMGADLKYMFDYCEKLQTVYVSKDKWIINNASDTNSMFLGCPCSEVTYI